MQGSRVPKALRKLLPGPGRIRNPWGRRGSPAHRAKILQIQEFLENIEWKRLTGGNSKEIAVKITSGRKNKRFPDLVMEDLQGRKIAIQVGKREKSGLPVKREREAILDLRKAIDIDKVWFVEY